MTRDDLAKHEALGIDAATLARAGVRRVDDAEARLLLSLNGQPGDFSGIEYPYVDPITGHRVTSRVRRDHPPRKPDGTSDGKYRAPYGDNRHLYFPPNAQQLLADGTAPVVVLESEKATLCVTAAALRASRRILAIGLGGCWNFRGRIGKDVDHAGHRVDVVGPLPDFQKVTWTDRTAIICFDARPNASVHAARQQLTRVLRGWGASVHHAHLPDDDRRVNGPDDLVAVHGEAALWHVLDSATPEDFTRDTHDSIVATSLDNIRLALSKLRVSLTYDEFARDVKGNGRTVEDVDLDRLWVQIDDRFHFRPAKDTLRTVAVSDAHEAPRHPVREYLDALKWDREQRLDCWLVTYGGAVDSAYVRAVGALPLIAAVRRVRQPGAKFDELLILEAPQGTLKSSALRGA